MCFNANTQENTPFYIVCEMKFKDKTYGLNLLVANWVATKKKSPTFFVFIF
jgi:hypothetical protein